MNIAGRNTLADVGAHSAASPFGPSVSDREAAGRWRVAFVIAGFGVLYAVVAFRLLALGLFHDEQQTASVRPVDMVAAVDTGTTSITL